MITKVDCLCMAGVTLAQQQWRKDHYQVLIAATQPDRVLLRTPTNQLWEYMQPTYKRYPENPNKLKYNCGLTHDLPGQVYVDVSDQRTRTVYVRRVVEFLQVNQLDGMYFDTPFDCPALMRGDYLKLYKEMQEALPGKVMANFGDLLTWSNTIDMFGGMASKAGDIFNRHFIEVAISLPKYHIRVLALLCANMSVQLSKGKSLIIGLYDPDRRQEDLALQLAEGLSQYNGVGVLIHYKTNLFVTSPEDSWNRRYD